MGFAGVYTAIYDYKPQAENELEISEGDLLYILDKDTDDGWWKAKKKAADVDEEEPVGLVPNNYVEEARPTKTARSLYDYTRQTDEEVSFSEDAELKVFDTSDPDWTLVQINSEYGFAPSNYIEIVKEIDLARPASPPPPPLPQRVDNHETESEGIPTPRSPSSPVENPAAALAGVLTKQQEPVSSARTRTVPVPSAEPSQSPPIALTPQASDEDDNSPPPALPHRPLSLPDSPQEPISPPEDSYPTRRDVPPPRPQYSRQYSSLRGETSPGVRPSPPYSRISTRDPDKAPSPSVVSPSGYHIYNISEMISIMGKRKKMPTTLGINVATGTIFISPENSEDGPHQEWTADRLTHYSIEGKHVFLDLVRPSKSVDFHAGAKDTAQEIVSALGEIAGGYKAEGLKEVIAAGTTGGKKKGQVLYDFMAQGDDEVTVAVGDEVIIVDDTKSEEWWMVRRMKNGQEGVVPSSYIEITGVGTPAESSYSGVNAGLSTVEQNRREEERLARESARKSRKHDSGSRERHKRESRSSKPKPDPSKTRKWTDRTGTFTVVAEFIGLTDGKIHLHKQNGVKIAVPVAKMSIEDLEYVERVTGESLDEDKPLSDIRRRNQMPQDRQKAIGASIKKEPDYDWFDFFLKAGVGPHLCERYAQNFSKDSMDESVLPDITSDTLRTLGLKEGDILRVIRYLDDIYNRKSKARNVSFGGEEVIGNGESSGSLFSGPGGTLRNNTRKGRPAPPVQTSDVVDPKAFTLKDPSKSMSTVEKESSQISSDKDEHKGFEDSAWEVKHPKSSGTAPPSVTVTQAQSQPALTGAMADLSLLQEPLQPAKPSPASQLNPPVASQPQPQSMPPQALQQQPQMTGANPAFFAQLGQPAMSQTPQIQGLNAQMTGFGQTQQQQTPQFQLQQAPMPPRQRPQPPPAMSQGSILPPPPQRPLSAPNNPSALGPAPLQPQLTGLPQTTPHLAPPGHSLAELNQQRFQQSQLQPQPTALAPPSFGIGQFGNQLAPQPTGLMGQQQGPFINGPQQTGIQRLAPQQTGFTGFSQPQLQQPIPTGSINSVLPPPLQPQRTGANGFGGTTNFTPPPPPPIPELPTAPLQPQKTGPAPPVRFGVHKDAKKLTPQPTGLKANLAQATPSNPFGF